jgi:hypothetical protein
MALDRQSTANTVRQRHPVEPGAVLASGGRMTVEATDGAAHARHRNPAPLRPPVIGRDAPLAGQRR